MDIILGTKYAVMVGMELFIIGMTGATLIAFGVCLIRRWSHKTAGSVQSAPSTVAHKSH